MPNFNARQTEESTSTFTPLETGEYVMRITKAQIAPSIFANDKGSFDDELKLRWELAEWNSDYEDAGYEENQAVFQQMRPWLGTTSKGPSKFKQLIDQLLEERLIPEDFWIAGEGEDDTQGDLIGVRRRVMVEKYTKSKGQNAGKPGNRVLAWAPLKPQPRKPQAAQAAPQPSRSMLPPEYNGKDLSDLEQCFNGVAEGFIVDKPDLVKVAKDMAWQAKGFWLKRDFEKANETQLAQMIKSMWTAIQRANSDPNEPLFPEE